MREWQKYFNGTFVISLARRQDRRTRMSEIFEEYDIEGEIFEATDIEKSPLGLVDSTRRLFEYCLEKGYSNCLVFEDDCEFLESPEVFHQTMAKCVEDLKNINWQIFYLGLQHPRNFLQWVTPNILPVNMAYATHALAYSATFMEFFLDYIVSEPIDNWIVRMFQPYGTCYCSYPILATQRTNYSDICGKEENWDLYITKSYENAVKDIMHLRK